jgi:hypothetical protein
MANEMKTVNELLAIADFFERDDMTYEVQDIEHIEITDVTKARQIYISLKENQVKLDELDDLMLGNSTNFGLCIAARNPPGRWDINAGNAETKPL